MSKKDYDKGMEVLDQMVGSNKEKYLDMLNSLSSGLGQDIVENTYGKRFGNNTLDLKTRQLINIALMIGNATPEQIEFHIMSGLNVGLTFDELEEMMLQSISVVGMPKALAALKVLKGLEKNK